MAIENNTMQSSQNFDLGTNIFSSINTGLSGFFNWQVAKENAKAIKNAPPATIGIGVIGIVAVAGLIIWAVKH